MPTTCGGVIQRPSVLNARCPPQRAHECQTPAAGVLIVRGDMVRALSSSCDIHTRPSVAICASEAPSSGLEYCPRRAESPTMSVPSHAANSHYLNFAQPYYPQHVPDISCGPDEHVQTRQAFRTSTLPVRLERSGGGSTTAHNKQHNLPQPLLYARARAREACRARPNKHKPTSTSPHTSPSYAMQT